MGMPVIVKTKNGDVVLADEVEFVLEGRIVLNFFGRVLVYIEGGFVSDDEILARSHSPLDNIEGSHHGNGDAPYCGIGISGKDAVDRLARHGTPT